LPVSNERVLVVPAILPVTFLASAICISFDSLLGCHVVWSSKVAHVFATPIPSGEGPSSCALAAKPGHSPLTTDFS
jgi:hypothetical protein